jgi:hypothetical protein
LTNETAKIFVTAVTREFGILISHYCESFLVKNKNSAGGRNLRNKFHLSHEKTFCDIFSNPGEIYYTDFLTSKNGVSYLYLQGMLSFCIRTPEKIRNICSLLYCMLVGVLCGVRFAVVQYYLLNSLTRPGGFVYMYRHTADQAAPLSPPILSELRSDLVAVHDSFSPAAVRPAQFFNPSHSVDPSRGEVALLQAILEDAIRCFQKQFISRRPRTLRLAKEAEEWLFTDDDKWPLSFVNVCAVLGLDPTYLRRKLKQLIPHPAAPLRRKKPQERSAHARLKVAA